MPPELLTVAVFAPGLLGGSLLLDARRIGVCALRVWARRQEALDRVTALGLADFCSTDATEAAQGADLLILCMPVGAMASAAQSIAAAGLPPGAVVTDVGSVKGSVVRTVGPILRAAGISFVGSHPMAGSHITGIEAARAGLFQDAACILTPETDADPAALEKVRGFWEALGCRVTELDADAHDAAVARVSHMPHIAAASVVLAALRSDPSLIHLGAGGLRDTTRVASGHPPMWREILTENRAAVLDSLRCLQADTGFFIRALESGDDAALLAALEEARALRAQRWPGRPDGRD